jgi:Xaa-Pro aminopeptidase
MFQLSAFKRIRYTNAMERIIYADSQSSADLLYATRFAAPDPFLYFTARGKSYVALSDLEVDRGRRDARVDRVLHWTHFREELRKKLGRRPTAEEACLHILKKHGVRRAMVPAQFPFRMALFLIRGGIKLSIPKGGLFPERLNKTKAEIREIEAALRITERLLGRAREILKGARRGPGKKLKWGGAVLTSECLRAEIQTAALRMGAVADQPIIASGAQACDPHDRGSGPLRAGELIVVDIFPRLQKSCYWGDMTRTFVKGKASTAQKKLFDTVRLAQERAFDLIGPGVRAEKVHLGVTSFFEKQGYATGEIAGRQQGFIHGTGHGLGLEIHEAPGLSAGSPYRLEPGNVVTVEPGLYYLRLGGVRIEDVVLVTSTGCRKLSRFPIHLEV